MATVIRLQRGGRTHAPYYRMVVMDGRKRTRGRVVDQLGVYHPCARPEPIIEVDEAKALQWLSKGAVPSDTVRSVFSRRGLMAKAAKGDFEVTPEESAPGEAIAEQPTPATDESAAE